MESMIMAVRICLLILATGTFTAIWSADRPGQMASVQRPRKVLLGQEKAKVGPAVQVKADTANVFEQSATIPLPDGISDGTYLIADQFGQTQIRIVAGQHADGATKQQSDHFSVTVGNARWHYIRVDHKVPAQLAESPSANGSLR